MYLEKEPKPLATSRRKAATVVAKNAFKPLTVSEVSSLYMKSSGKADISLAITKGNGIVELTYLGTLGYFEVTSKNTMGIKTAQHAEINVNEAVTRYNELAAKVFVG